MSQLEAMLLSLAVEVPLALGLVALMRSTTERAEWGRLALVAVAATLLSHPFAWFANEHLTIHWPVRAAIIEVSVTVLEAVLYAWLGRLGLWRGLAVSTVANAGSFGVGLLVFYYWL